MGHLKGKSEGMSIEYIYNIMHIMPFVPILFTYYMCSAKYDSYDSSYLLHYLHYLFHAFLAACYKRFMWDIHDASSEDKLKIAHESSGQLRCDLGEKVIRLSQG